MSIKMFTNISKKCLKKFQNISKNFKNISQISKKYLKKYKKIFQKSAAEDFR